MNIFIDTNIYLSFYHLTNESLQELHKVLVLQQKDRVKVFVTRHVKREFDRNRENKLADALKNFRDEGLNQSIPQFAKETAAYDKLNRVDSAI